MKIQLWYSKDMDLWRWSLTDDMNDLIQESGQRPVLRDAMNDVATTVEHILNTEYSGEKQKIELSSKV
jgi:hypothetical protein|tara:strand:- start:383 stop:586 length:204 start_codon:yes stop_codon:yes gene_type:complete